MDFDELNFENVIKDAEKKKKRKKGVNSKDKGNRTELNLAKLLKERFGFEFTRTVGSGNRHGQVFFLPAHAQQVYSGDLVCPENFKFVVECKGGYKKIKLHSTLQGGLALIDEWIEEALAESKRCGRMPVIAWKKDYMPWLGFVQTKNLKGKKIEYSMKYRDWTVFSLQKLFEFPDDFFFKS
jgi:Holliday junction resolvase